MKHKKIVISITLVLNLAHQTAMAQFDPSLELNDLDGLNGITINGVDPVDSSGSTGSGAGDINGDGIDDLIIGALGADPNGQVSAGSSYVVFGSDTGLPNPFDLSTLDGSNGFTINGVNTNDDSGFSVSTAGDINGDGINDLVIGAPFTDPNGNSNVGSSYVVFGSNSPLPNPFDLFTLDGSNGLVFNGLDTFDSTGFSVNAAGDINDDGVDDLIIGASNANPNGNNSAGSSYVIFGNDLIFKDGFE